MTRPIDGLIQRAYEEFGAEYQRNLPTGGEQRPGAHDEARRAGVEAVVAMLVEGDGRDPRVQASDLEVAREAVARHARTLDDRALGHPEHVERDRDDIDAELYNAVRALDPAWWDREVPGLNGAASPPRSGGEGDDERVEARIAREIGEAKDRLLRYAATAESWTAYELKKQARGPLPAATMGLALGQLVEEGRLVSEAHRVRLPVPSSPSGESEREALIDELRAAIGRLIPDEDATGRAFAAGWRGAVTSAQHVAAAFLRDRLLAAPSSLSSGERLPAMIAGSLDDAADALEKLASPSPEGVAHCPDDEERLLAQRTALRSLAEEVRAGSSSGEQGTEAVASIAADVLQLRPLLAAFSPEGDGARVAEGAELRRAIWRLEQLVSGAAPFPVGTLVTIDPDSLAFDEGGDAIAGGWVTHVHETGEVNVGHLCRMEADPDEEQDGRGWRWGWVEQTIPACDLKPMTGEDLCEVQQQLVDAMRAAASSGEQEARGYVEMVRFAAVAEDVRAERERQTELVRAGKIPWDCADPAVTPEHAAMRLGVLVEEVGEVAKAQIEQEPPRALYAELVQVAAVACAWAESVLSESAPAEEAPDV